MFRSRPAAIVFNSVYICCTRRHATFDVIIIIIVIIATVIIVGGRASGQKQCDRARSDVRPDGGLLISSTESGTDNAAATMAARGLGRQVSAPRLCGHRRVRTPTHPPKAGQWPVRAAGVRSRGFRCAAATVPSLSSVHGDNTYCYCCRGNSSRRRPPSHPSAP